ncbi:MAG: hypothetical protein CSA65_03770 [Proteobacteria bacterium]|nr:MAG: hypothetical protein CSB49_04605 [Pseudomonadota bacterium]PIE18933.1 MAG: hypothetical protein CSA65_03770 [Pseudomonadota bacterium]
MNRKTWTAAGIFVVLLPLSIWVMRAPDTGERVGDRERPLPKLQTNGFNRVTITGKGKSVTLVKVGEAWKLTTPMTYDADKYATESMEKKLIALSFGDLVSDRKQRHGEFEVDDKKGTRVVVAQGDKTIADFYLGKSVSGFTMFRKAGEEKVWQVAGSLRSTFARTVDNWRDRRIIAFKQDKARKLEFATAAGTITVARKGPKTPWTVVSSPISLGKIDQQAIRSALSALASLTASAFHDKLKSSVAGLDKPLATLMATLEGESTSYRLEIGAATKKKGRYVRVAGKPQTFEIQAYTAKRLLKRPIDLKDKTMLSLEQAKIQRLTLRKLSAEAIDGVQLTRGKGKDGKPSTEWFSVKVDKTGPKGKGKKVASTTKLSEGLKTLATLKADHYPRVAASELGLESPAWTVTVELEDSKTIELAIGSKLKDKCRAVRIGSRPDIYMVRKYVLERFLLEPKNYL